MHPFQDVNLSCRSDWILRMSILPIGVCESVWLRFFYFGVTDVNSSKIQSLHSDWKWCMGKRGWIEKKNRLCSTFGLARILIYLLKSWLLGMISLVCSVWLKLAGSKQFFIARLATNGHSLRMCVWAHFGHICQNESKLWPKSDQNVTKLWPKHVQTKNASKICPKAVQKWPNNGQIRSIASKMCPNFWHILGTLS